MESSGLEFCAILSSSDPWFWNLIKLSPWVLCLCFSLRCIDPDLRLDFVSVE